MAMSVQEVRDWVNSLDKRDSVAVDDGGLALVELDPNGVETGAYLEVGGVPADAKED